MTTTERKGCMAEPAAICLQLDGPTVSRLADYAEFYGFLIQNAAQVLFMQALDRWEKR